MSSFSNKVCRLSLSLLGAFCLGTPMPGVAAASCVEQPAYCYTEDQCCNPCETSCCGIGTNAAVLGGAIILGGVAGAIAGNNHKSKRGHSGSSGSFDLPRDIGQTIDGTAFVTPVIALGTTATFTVSITGPDQVVHVGLPATYPTAQFPGPIVPLLLPAVFDPAFGSYTVTVQVNVPLPSDIITFPVGAIPVQFVLSRSPIPFLVAIPAGPLTGATEYQLSTTFTYGPAATLVP